MKFSFIKDWTSPWRAYLAELLGTFIFIFISSGIVLADIFYTDIGPVGISLAIGLAYAASIFATTHLSGGYLNPAITLALWLTQKLSPPKTFFFIFAQVLASFAAAGLLFFIFGKISLEFGLGSPQLSVNATLQQAVVLEAVLTAILVFAVFATMVDRNGPVGFGPLACGLLLTGETLLAFSITGAALNPARAFGSAILSNSYGNLVVFIVGPLVGSLFAFIYDFLFLRKVKR